jgi:hypothetical protein
VDEVIKELKKNTGFNAYVIMNNDGIVIRHEHMEYKTAVHHAYLVSLCPSEGEREYGGSSVGGGAASCPRVSVGPEPVQQSAQAHEGPPRRARGACKFASSQLAR